MAMNAAAVDDVIAWCILAVVLAVVRSFSPITALYTILSTAAVILAMVIVVRPALAWIFCRLDRTSDTITTNSARMEGRHGYTTLVITVGALSLSFF